MSTDARVITEVASGVAGLIAGSFAGVLVERVPRKESIVSPASHCDACGTPLRGQDNVPIVSYLMLGGRCRSCRARIPASNLFVELATCVLFVVLAWRLPTEWALPGYFVVATALVALSVIDLRLRRLPSAIIYWTGALAALLLVLASAVTGDWGRLVSMAAGAAGCFAFFFVVFFIAPKGIGFGDVRLAALCGGALGWIGAREIPFGVLVGFLLAAVPAVALLILGKATRKSQLAFGPYVALGSVVGICFGRAVLHSVGLF